MPTFQMKILLINPFPYYSNGPVGTLYPPLGLLYVAAVLEDNGYKVTVYDANFLRTKWTSIRQEILHQKPNIVGISTNVLTSRVALELAKEIKNNFRDIVIVMGGPMATAAPDVFLQVGDIIIRGEGEETIRDTVKAIDDGAELDNIKGISFLRNGTVFTNPPRELISFIDEIPFPAYHLLIPRLKNYSSNARIIRKFMAPLLTSRGCPYRCTFCCKNIFGTEYRMRSVENVYKEIQWLRREFGVNQLDILDNNFTLNQERTKQFFKLLISNNCNAAINLQNGIRADKLSKDTLRDMKAAGVFKIGIGIESGDKEILQTINKQLDLNKVEEIIIWCKKLNIVTIGFFMFGLPGDTAKTMRTTIDFMKRANPTFAQISICIPFPGSAMYEEIKKNPKNSSIVTEGIESGYFGSDVFFDPAKATKDEVLNYYWKAYYDFYFRSKKVLEILFSIRSFHEFLWIVKTGGTFCITSIRKFILNQLKKICR